MLVDQRTGLVHDYTRKGGVVSTEIITPDAGSVERNALWNAAEAAEKRKDSRTAREWIVALPAELDSEQRRALTRDFAAELAARYQVAVDVAIHLPDRDGDNRNHHAHILTTTRQVSRDAAGGLVMGDKATIELSDHKRRGLGHGPAADEVTKLRQLWERKANQALERAGSAARIDARSLKAQGIEREATTHLGPVATEMERRGLVSDRGEGNRQAAAHSAQRASLGAEIIDLQKARSQRATPAEPVPDVAKAAKKPVKTERVIPPYARNPHRVATIADIEARSRQLFGSVREVKTPEPTAPEVRAVETSVIAPREVVQEQAPIEAKQPVGLESLSALELIDLRLETRAEIRRLEPPSVSSLVQADPLVRAAQSELDRLEKTWETSIEEDVDARRQVAEWRKENPKWAWLHDKGWKSSFLVQAAEYLAKGPKHRQALTPQLDAAKGHLQTAKQQAEARIVESQKPVRQQIEQLERTLKEISKASERAQERSPSGEILGARERMAASMARLTDAVSGKPVTPEPAAQVRQVESPAPVAREAVQKAPEQAEPVRDEVRREDPEQEQRKPLIEPEMDWDEDESGMDMD